MSFDNLKGADQWADALKALIEESQTAETLEERLDISKRLTEFITRSRPADETERAAIDQLDKMAGAVSEAVLIAEIQQRVQAITARANELAALQKTFASAASKNLAAAKSIRLENLRAAITAATGIIESLNKVKGDLAADPAASEEQKGISTKIDRALKSVQDARNALELLGVPISL